MSNEHESLEQTLGGLTLEPLDGAPSAAPPKARAVFQVDTRAGGDRRKQADRRQTVRFEADRRQGPRRARGDAWTGNSFS